MPAPAAFMVQPTPVGIQVVIELGGTPASFLLTGDDAAELARLLLDAARGFHLPRTLD